MNLLFVCSKNQWRSPTAEAVFKNHSLYKAKSAGTENGARIKVNQKMLDWADMIFVMETKHRERIVEKFDVKNKIVVLDIPDEYKFMDPELIDLLKISISPYIDF